MWRPTTRGLTTVVVLAVAVVMFPLLTSVSAQEPDAEEPLRLAYVDISGARGYASYGAVEEMLEQSSQIDLVDPDDIVDRARDVGLDDEIFEADRRGDHEHDLAALMWKEDVEALLVHDIHDAASRMTVAAIGPLGWELTTSEQSLHEGDLEQQDAMQVLEEVFSALVPEVRGFRSEVEQGQWTDDDFELSDDAGAEDDLDLRERAAEEHRKQYGNLGRRLDVYAGLMTGHRGMSMTGAGGDFNLEHNTVLVGPAVRIDSKLMTFDRDTAALEAGAVFGMAPFETTFEGEELGGQYLRMGGEIRYISALSATTRLRGIAGVETMNMSLDPNERYTGHGYLTGRFGGGLHYAYEDLAVVQADLLFMPLINVSNSGGEYGDTSGWLGAGADLGVILERFDPFMAGVNYSFQLYNSDNAEPGGDLDGGLEATDMVHSALITVGYRL